MPDPGHQRDGVFLRRLLIAILILILVLFLGQILHVLLLAFGAVLVAVLLRALSNLLTRHTPLRDRWAFGIAVVLLLLLVGSASWLFGSEVRAQVTDLAGRLPEAWKAFQQRFGQSDWMQQLTEQVRGGGAGAGSSGMLAKLGGLVAAILRGTTDFIIMLFGGFYLALHPDIYRRGVIMLMPKSCHHQAGEALHSCGEALRLWLLGQLVSMLLVGMLTTIGLVLIGVPSALALGLLAALAEFVPVIGPIAAAIPGLLIAMTVDMNTALWTLLLYLLIQQIEGNVIQPLVQRRMVALPPALLIFAILAMGIVFGPLGILFAAPLTVVAFVLVKRLYVRDTLGEQIWVPGDNR
jgi:predicted PurR-regulated permease PerM